MTANNTNTKPLTSIRRLAVDGWDTVPSAAIKKPEPVEVPDNLDFSGGAPVRQTPVAPAQPEIPPDREAEMSRNERVEHLLADQNASIEAGFDLKAPVFALGTSVNSTGVENAQRSRREFEAMASVSDTLSSLINLIDQERREDVFISLNDACMSASAHFNGNQHNLNEGPWRELSQNGFAQLCDLAGFPSGARYLWNNCPPNLRAININHQLKNARELRADRHYVALRRREEARHHFDGLGHLTEEERALEMFKRFSVTTPDGVEIPDKDIIIRARTRLLRAVKADNITREIFAATSRTYTPIDFTNIASAVEAALTHGDARASYDYFYDKAAGLVDIVFHSDIKASNYSAGEVFKAFVRIKFDDARQGSVKITAGLWRNLCLNLIILDVSEVECGRIVHTGNPAGRVKAIEEAVARALSKIEHFVSKWDSASRQLITNPRDIERHSAKAAKAVGKTWDECDDHEKIAGLINGYVAVKALPQLNRQIITGIADAYTKDALTGDTRNITKAGLINAVTRYAQDSMDRWSADALERAAGGLTWNEKIQPVFQYVRLAA